MPNVPRLDALEQARPEWAPWLAVVRVCVSELGAKHWVHSAARALDREGCTGGTGPWPRLARSAAAPEPRSISKLLATLVRSAGSDGRAAHRGFARTPDADAEFAMAAFRAALRSDERALREMAGSAGLDAPLFVSLALLLPTPWLHACRQALASTLPCDWRSGYCPCCGAWPALAQVCGIERSRYLVCGRCGTPWQASPLLCPFCRTADHRELGTLRIEPAAEGTVIEVCGKCNGYVKTLKRLSLGAAEDVLMDDLESVELDLVATAHGYRRPSGLGHPFAD